MQYLVCHILTCPFDFFFKYPSTSYNATVPVVVVAPFMLLVGDAFVDGFVDAFVDTFVEVLDPVLL